MVIISPEGPFWELGKVFSLSWLWTFRVTYMDWCVGGHRKSVILLNNKNMRVLQNVTMMTKEFWDLGGRCLTPV